MKYRRVVLALFFCCFVLGKNLYADPPPVCECDEGFELSSSCDASQVCDDPETCCVEVVTSIQDNVAICILIGLGLSLAVYTFYQKEPYSANL